jgi:hypothetical protein
MTRNLILAVALFVTVAPPVAAQGKWEILDNSFLVEESFNQEAGVFQNIFTWTRVGRDTWEGTFTQEWPVPGIRHQLSYTVPFSRSNGASGLNDVMVNYRYQVLEETARRPAFAPRASLIVPTGREADGLGDGTFGLEINLPASKQFGDIYVHANAGLRWLPDADRHGFVAASAIWRTTPMFNLMLEVIDDFEAGVTVSPGFRRAWNVGERQIVIGFAVPVTRSSGTSTAAALSYFSYELPFR